MLEGMCYMFARNWTLDLFADIVMIIMRVGIVDFEVIRKRECV